MEKIHNYISGHGQTDRHEDRQTGRQIGRQKDRQKDRQTDKQKDSQELNEHFFSLFVQSSYRIPQCWASWLRGRSY